MFILKNSQKNLGFTLTEMLTVLVIAGILFAVTAPNLFKQFKRQEVRNAMDEVEYGLKEAQNFAKRKGQRCEVTLDTTNNKIASTSGCLISARVLPDQLTLSTNIVSDPPTISFSYKGNITHDPIPGNDQGTIVISSSNDDYGAKCIVLNQALGLIQSGFYDGSPSTIISSKCKKPSD